MNHSIVYPNNHAKRYTISHTETIWNHQILTSMPRPSNNQHGWHIPAHIWNEEKRSRKQITIRKHTQIHEQLMQFQIHRSQHQQCAADSQGISSLKHNGWTKTKSNGQTTTNTQHNASTTHCRIAHTHASSHTLTANSAYQHTQPHVRQAPSTTSGRRNSRWQSVLEVLAR